MLLNWLLGYKMLHMSQFFLQHGKFTHSFSSSDFSFDRTSLSRRDFGLRNATRGGFGSTDFNKNDKLCAFPTVIKQWICRNSCTWAHDVRCLL